MNTTEPRVGDWMQTWSGRMFWPIDPRPEEVFIEDIAAALSNVCRYAGHCRGFYSVAEHCVHVANAAPDHLKLEALLHDASEAYIADITRSVKPYLANYHQIEDGVMRAVSARFGTNWPMHDEVKRLDNAILADEQFQIMETPPRPWNLPEPPLGVKIEMWSPERARSEFLLAFLRYGGAAC